MGYFTIFAVQADEKMLKGFQIRMEGIKELIEPLFSRKEGREAAFNYVRGLLSRIERKNSWQLAEQAELKDPYAFQYLLGRVRWNCEALRDQFYQKVPEGIGRGRDLSDR